MPKFLDVPSWYNSQGILTYGVGVDTDEQPVVGDVPCVHLPSGELNWRHLMVNGATSGDINIYTPTSRGDSGQVVTSGDGYTPGWSEFKLQSESKLLYGNPLQSVTHRVFLNQFGITSNTSFFVIKMYCTNVSLNSGRLTVNYGNGTESSVLFGWAFGACLRPTNSIVGSLYLAKSKTSALETYSFNDMTIDDVFVTATYTTSDTEQYYIDAIWIDM